MSQLGKYVPSCTYIKTFTNLFQDKSDTFELDFLYTENVYVILCATSNIYVRVYIPKQKPHIYIIIYGLCI